MEKEDQQKPLPLQKPGGGYHLQGEQIVDNPHIDHHGHAHEKREHAPHEKAHEKSHAHQEKGLERDHHREELHAQRGGPHGDKKAEFLKQNAPGQPLNKLEKEQEQLKQKTQQKLNK